MFVNYINFEYVLTREGKRNRLNLLFNPNRPAVAKAMTGKKGGENKI